MFGAPRRRIAYPVFALTLLVAATSCVGGGRERIVAFGDVHGDLEATRIVMGHSRVDGIASACGERAWRIDVGMAA